MTRISPNMWIHVSLNMLCITCCVSFVAISMCHHYKNVRAQPRATTYVFRNTFTQNTQYDLMHAEHKENVSNMNNVATKQCTITVHNDMEICVRNASDSNCTAC